jgi:hypothetical protein
MPLCPVAQSVLVSSFIFTLHNCSKIISCAWTSLDFSCVPGVFPSSLLIKSSISLIAPFESVPSSPSSNPGQFVSMSICWLIKLTCILLHVLSSNGNTQLPQSLRTLKLYTRLVPLQEELHVIAKCHLTGILRVEHQDRSLRRRT